MKIIGITGGIGCGKSTVADILFEMGATVIYADEISREITMKNNPAYNQIVCNFGDEILNHTNMEINRGKLAKIVFNNAEKLDLLNKITHKYIIKEIIDEVNDAVSDICVIDSAIPFEHGFLDIVNEIWVITCDINTRIERVIKRTRITREDVLNVIKCQKSDEEYNKIASIIIKNSGSIDELKIKIEGLLRNR